MAVNRNNIVHDIVDALDGHYVTTAVAAAALEEALLSIATALKAGDAVDLRGFGTFKVKDTAARTGRNLRTGELMEIPAGRRVTFKASKLLLG